jgi:hypothetical protein
VRRPERAAPKKQTPHRGVATTFMRWLIRVLVVFRKFGKPAVG